MTTRSNLLTPAVAIAFSGLAFGQADECAAATDLGTGNSNTPFDTNVCTDTMAPATTSAEQQCFSLTEDVWFKFTASMSGLAQIDTCGTATFDTEIGVWRGGDCATMTPLGCNDDGAGCAGLTSLITIPIAAGETYHVQLGYWSTAGGVWGTGTLNITEMMDPCQGQMDDSFEENDDCTSASALMPGNYTGLFASLADPDYYEITFGPDEILDLSLIDTPNEDLDLRLYDSSCSLVQSFNTDGIAGFPSGSSVSTVVVEVFVDPAFFGSGCLNYDMDLIISPDPCVGQMDDSFEENDVCTMPASIMQGTQAGLFASLADPDFYEITVAPNDILSVQLVETSTTGGDLDLNQFDSGCNLLTFWNTDGFTYQNISGAPEQVIFEVFVDPAFAGLGCLTYDMTVSTSTPPDCSMADQFEPNLDCSTAFQLGDGSYGGLNVEDGDNDYYSVGVDPGATISVDIFFIDSFADVDLYLWDPNISCDTNVAGPGTGTGALSVGFTTSDNESVSYTNTTGAAQNLIVEVDMFSTGGCNGYDMDIAGSNGMGGGIGTNYCMANANSTGVPAVISAMGSRVAASNDVTLTTSDMPQNAFGFFLVSDVSGFVPNPGGSEGNLCLGGGIGRYVGPGQVMNAGAAGEISLVLDLTTIPRPMSNASAMSGDTWFWTTWFRDSNMGMSTSNFSDGIQIDFL